MSKLLSIVAANQDDFCDYLGVAAKFHNGTAAALTKAAELFTNLSKASQTTQAFYDAIVTKAASGPEQDLAKAQAALFKTSGESQTALATVFTDLSKAATEIGTLCKAASEYDGSCDDDEDDDDDDEEVEAADTRKSAKTPMKEAAKAAKAKGSKAAKAAAGAGADGAGAGTGAGESELAKALASINTTLTNQNALLTSMATRVDAVEKAAGKPPAAVNGAAGAAGATGKDGEGADGVQKGAGAGAGAGDGKGDKGAGADGKLIERPAHEDPLAKGARHAAVISDDDTGL